MDYVTRKTCACDAAVLSVQRPRAVGRRLRDETQSDHGLLLYLKGVILLLGPTVTLPGRGGPKNCKLFLSKLVLSRGTHCVSAAPFSWGSKALGLTITRRRRTDLFLDPPARAPSVSHPCFGAACR